MNFCLITAAAVLSVFDQSTNQPTNQGYGFTAVVVVVQVAMEINCSCCLVELWICGCGSECYGDSLRLWFSFFYSKAMVADCRANCTACWANKRKAWYCLTCRAPDGPNQQKNTLITKTLHPVTSEVAGRLCSESDRVYNHVAPSKRLNEIYPGLSYMSTFLCKVCRSPIGYRHVVNHCPSRNPTVVKHLKNHQLFELEAGRYIGRTYRVVYYVLINKKLVCRDLLRENSCNLKIKIAGGKGPRGAKGSRGRKRAAVQTDDALDRGAKGSRGRKRAAVQTDDELDRGAKTIYINGFVLCEDIERLLRNHFSICGAIGKVFISRGFAFMEFVASESCVSAMVLNGSLFNNAPLAVRCAVTRYDE